MGLWTGKQCGSTYVPSTIYRLLKPKVSGNTINGLNQSNKRQPKPIFWHNSKRIIFGRLQQWMAARFFVIPIFWRVGYTLVRQLKMLRNKPNADDYPSRELPPKNWTELVKKQATAYGADLVGVTAVNPDWVFEGYEKRLPRMIVIGAAMHYPQLSKAPEPAAAIEVMDKYNKGREIAILLRNWICEQGWHATAHSGPFAGSINLIPAALACGFGELGKHGSIINRKLGSSFRLACVLTDVPLVEDGPDKFGADDFCHLCNLCTKQCPPEAIFEEKQLVRGVDKWYVDFDKCLPYFVDTHGCAICIAVCPWSRPDLTAKLVDKMLRRQIRATPVGLKFIYD